MQNVNCIDFYRFYCVDILHRFSILAVNLETAVFLASDAPLQHGFYILITSGLVNSQFSRFCILSLFGILRKTIMYKNLRPDIRYSCDSR